MTPGPSTVRPSIGADALLERIRARNLTSFLVTRLTVVSSGLPYARTSKDEMRSPKRDR